MLKSIRSVLRTCAAASILLQLAVAQNTPPPASAAHRDAANAANAGRSQLNAYLDSLAADYAASRRAKVSTIHTRAGAEDRQAMVRKKIVALIGTLPPHTPLNVKLMGVTQADGFRIQKLILDSQPGFRIPALLYLPDGQPARQKLPAILISPGHAPSGKASDYTSAATFARNGFIVLSYDPIGQGERLQYPNPKDPNQSLATRPTGEHGEASLQPMLIGDTLDRYMLWDAMRGIDYLSNLPQVDPKRIGAFGCSGGGAITALLGALDKRVAAIAVACYTTSFDTLLPTLGPQDGEQSIPHFIASGFDFPDWIELAAPRPYAVVATYSDMFPFAGARSTVIEVRRFYSLFDPNTAGAPSGTDSAEVPPTPTGPALNADTPNKIPLTAPLQFITGPGHHGALAPILGDIVGFFIRNLKPGADATHPILPSPANTVLSPMATPASLPKDAFQVTPTGQVATTYPDSETIFSLNRKRAAKILPPNPQPLTVQQLTDAIREATQTSAHPGTSTFDPTLLSAKTGDFTLPSTTGIGLHGNLYVPSTLGPHPAVILLVPDSIAANTSIALSNKARFESLAAAGNIVLAITPRPSPPGTDDMKSPILGPFYLLSLRADLVSRTLVGMRIDDVARITDYFASRPDVDPARITATASGHLGLVLLHVAVLDPRLKHISVDHVLTSYRSLIDAPLPIGAPEDIIPGVLLHYDIPDLVRSLGPRLTETDPLQGTEDLSQSSTPLTTLEPSAHPTQ
ncbi:MAG TPA: acetylxylan esterase [Acidobacteriaceae bacterium]|nr:acetylxylan esterase [Acidobacteriaceae bacterium]